jgi:hypothetical protein
MYIYTETHPLFVGECKHGLQFLLGLHTPDFDQYLLISICMHVCMCVSMYVCSLCKINILVRGICMYVCIY